MTRQQLEAVIFRQLAAQSAAEPGSPQAVDALVASKLTILDAVDDWAAGHADDASTMRAAAAVLTRRSGPGRPNLVTDILIRVLGKAADRYDTTGGTR